MSKLLNDLSTGAKAAFQSYTLEHGIERLQVMVPLKQAPTFEKRFSELNTKSKAAVMQLIESCGGKVKA